MINFRYHLISIVAVFLALGIGIVMGSTVIDRAIVDGLQNRIDKAEKNSIERKVENERLKNSVEKQDAQDTILSGHAVRGYLTNQTVFVVVLGGVDDDVIVETRELIAVSGGRLGSEILFENDFLKSDKSKIAKELQKIQNVKALQQGEKNVDRQIAIVFADMLNQRAGGTSETPINSEEVIAVFSKFNSYNEREEFASFDPIQKISFIVLSNRTNLADKNVLSFATHLNTVYPTTIGLVGTDLEVPSRNNVLTSFKDRTSFFSFVDNAESPSGRASLLIAHSQNIAGKRGIFGVSKNVEAPSPELLAS